MDAVVLNGIIGLVSTCAASGVTALVCHKLWHKKEIFKRTPEVVESQLESDEVGRRRQRALAEETELKNAERRGELMPKSEFEEATEEWEQSMRQVGTAAKKAAKEALWEARHGAVSLSICARTLIQLNNGATWEDAGGEEQLIMCKMSYGKMWSLAKDNEGWNNVVEEVFIKFGRWIGVSEQTLIELEALRKDSITKGWDYDQVMARAKEYGW